MNGQPGPGMLTLRLLLTSLLVCILAGCQRLTHTVNDAVSASNAVMLEATLATTNLPVNPNAQTDDTLDWQKVVNQIYAFADTHPDKTAINNSLYMRAGMVLLSAKQFNRARAAFNDISSRSELGNTRDQVLYGLRNELLWWYNRRDDLRKTPPALPSNAERPRFDKHLLTICKEANALTDQADIPIRRFLEEWHVLIAWQFGNTYASAEDIKRIYTRALARYIAQFDVAERKAIQVWAQTPNASTASLSDLRWYDFVPQPFAQADSIWQKVTETSDTPFTPEWIACTRADGTCAGSDIAENIEFEEASSCQSYLSTR